MLELGVLLISILGNIFLGVTAYRANKKSHSNVLFAALVLVTIFWTIATYATRFIPTYLPNWSNGPQVMLTAVRMTMFFAAAQIFLIFLLVHTFPRAEIQLKRWKLITSTIYTFVVMAVALSPVMFTGLKDLYPINPIPGPGIVFFLALAILFFGSSIFLLIKKATSTRGILKQQINYLAFGIITSFGLIALSNFVLLVFFNNPSFIFLTPAYTLIMIGSITYATVAHQLFDIRLIIRKTVVYSGLLLFTLGIYSGTIFFLSALLGGGNAFQPTNFVTNLIAATFIAVGFEPIRRYLTRVTDKYLFKGDYDPQSVLAQLSQKLSGSVDIKEANQSLVTLVKTEMRLSRAAVITFGEEESKIIVKQATQDGYPNPAVLQLPPENLFLQHFAHSPETIVTDILKSMCESGDKATPNSQLCHILLVDLKKLDIAVAIPIKVNEKAVGMFLVGEKLSGDAYTKNEIEFLQIVANQTANTIQKARFWEEDQLKSEFVSIASHELLTPTAAMKGYLSMILDDGMGEIDDTARKYLTKVYQSSERLAHLVEDLLNVSRIESGRLKINKKEFSLVESVQKATEELSVNATNKSLDLAFVAPPQLLQNVYADPDHIYRVLINLIGNSVKYTSQGWVRCFVTQQDSKYLRFTVCDSGLGIPQENISHLFEKFYRADRKEIAGIQGTGLGLYISKKIIDLMGGQMWVESQVGKGTSFYFTLPIAGTDTAKQSQDDTAHATPVTAPVATTAAVPAAAGTTPTPPPTISS